MRETEVEDPFHTLFSFVGYLKRVFLCMFVIVPHWHDRKDRHRRIYSCELEDRYFECLELCNGMPNP